MRRIFFAAMMGPMPHGERLLGHIVPGGEETGVGIDGALSQVHYVGGLDKDPAGLIEANMAVVAHTQQLEVNSA